MSWRASTALPAARSVASRAVGIGSIVHIVVIAIVVPRGVRLKSGEHATRAVDASPAVETIAISLARLAGE